MTQVVKNHDLGQDEITVGDSTLIIENTQSTSAPGDAALLYACEQITDTEPQENLTWEWKWYSERYQAYVVGPGGLLEDRQKVIRVARAGAEEIRQLVGRER